MTVRMKLIVATSVASLLAGSVAFAGSVSGLQVFHNGEVADADPINDNFSAIESAVNDNDLRIDQLSGAGVGRMFIPPKLIDTSLAAAATTVTLPDGVTTAFNVVIGEPHDYVPSGSNDVVIKPLISGCGGSDVAINVQVAGNVIGSNSGLIVVFPSTPQAVSVPPNTGSPPFFNFSIVAPEFTTTGFSDMTTISVRREGAHANDTCLASAVLRGLIVEYPTAAP